MSILIETTFGDLVIDLDVDGSSSLSKNILKLAKARYYTNTLVYNVVPGRYCQMGDPRGDGSGGTSIHGLIDSTKSSTDVTKSQKRFLQSQGRFLKSDELNQKGLVIAMEMGNVPNTIGSQFLITLSNDNGLKDMVPVDDNKPDMNGEKKIGRYLSLGRVVEDDNDVLSKLNRSYCDDDGRPFADIRIQRILVIHDPFEDSEDMKELLSARGVKLDESSNDVTDPDFYALAPQSPDYERPHEEVVPSRIQADDTTLFANEYHDEEEEDDETRQKRIEMQQKQEEEWKKRQDTSRAVMLEMLGDLPSAEIQAPEDVLFVCKLNPLTTDEDLELIFSRFDQNAKAEIIRDPDTGDSLQYAFVEFTSKEACNEAYLKMNNALVDDRRIKVDFSQSVAKVWDRYNKKLRGVDLGYKDGGGGRGWGGRGRGRGQGRGDMVYRGRGRGNMDFHRRDNAHPNRQPPPDYHTSHPKRPHRDSRSNSRDAERNKRHSRSYSPEKGGERRRKRRSRSPSSSRSRSRSSSRHTRHKKKHRHHDRHKHHHKHHCRKDKKKRKKHHRHHRSMERTTDDSGEGRRSRSSSPRSDNHRDNAYSSHRRDDEHYERRSKEHRSDHDDRKHRRRH
ncbi:hypothetical protein ACHAWO_011972 [Cyclotella atomus]|uniref:Peptidyl-prolyl cis-trans isomerase n=1 Tax=Cyclotella atomus TaxID=382360 RepID=A0ABD3PBX1_9STRA